MNRKTTLAAVVAMALIGGLVTQYPASGADDSSVWVATLVSVEGAVEVRRQGEDVWKPLGMNERMFDGDTLRVQRRGRAALQFRNSTLMRLDQETTVTLGESKPKRSFWVQVLTGASYFFSHAPRSLEIRTPFVNGSIEGTEFAVAVGQNEGSIDVFDGRVAMVNEHGRLVLGPLESGVAAAGKPPVTRHQVASQDMVQWSVFFPPVLGHRADDFRESPAELRAAVQTALAKRQVGDMSGALAALPEKMDDFRDPRVFVLRAELLMALGRYAEANTDLAGAVAIKPDSADVLALKAMAVLISGRNEEALAIARKAVEADVRSVGARTALSYTYQAATDLDSALAAAREALAIDEGNALARARVAELLLMRGERRAAVAEASKAVAQNPSEALAHTALGFAHLARTDRRAAQAAFEKAVALAPADPQPRLGLGLAKIRGGDLAGGRAELEIAVALDPHQSLLRSYLGKAYAEENRDALAERELSRAKVLDLNDPTPYLYDAMRKQTLNQPGAALSDIRESVELNDCRAVYRSRLLLDRDLAVRGVSQARIYEDLGFSQLAFSEACRSVTLDPGNASAHRFLADAYANMPRSEIARESELLVAQLRQPHGAGLIQPRLGEARPGVLTGVGAVDPAYNEYTRLFERDGWRGMASFFAGNQESWGQEVIAGGVFGRYALSAGESRIMSDGWRENADVDERVQSVIGNIAVTPEFTLLAGYKWQEVNEGDTALRFDPDDYLQTLRQRNTHETVQLGGHLVLSPRSDLIAVGHRQDLRLTSSETMTEPFRGSVLAGREHLAWDGELQYRYQGRRSDITAGGGHYGDRRATHLTVAADMGEEGPQNPSTDEEATTRHDNIHLYMTLRPLDSLNVILGGGADQFSGPDADRRQLNPKVGVVWMPTVGMTVRAAGFRSLKRSLVAQQTVEPADVAGFQQFRDDQDAADTWKYGLGVDQKLGRRWFLGATIEKESAELPYILEDAEGSRRMTAGRRNWLLRSYCYGLLTPLLSAGVEFYTLRQDSDTEDAPFAREVDTHWLPVSLRCHLPNGLLLNLRTTVVRQSGRFPDAETGDIEAAADTFVTSDAEVGYRLPRRRGILSIEGRNVFDRQFKYQSAELDLPVWEPARLVLIKLTATF